MNQASHKAFRLSTMLFAVVLGLQCAWLLLPELLGVDDKWAAEIGVIRGDLWEKLAFTYADLMGDDADAEQAPISHGHGHLSTVHSPRPPTSPEHGYCSLD